MGLVLGSGLSQLLLPHCGVTLTLIDRLKPSTESAQKDTEYTGCVHFQCPLCRGDDVLRKVWLWKILEDLTLSENPPTALF